MNRLPPLPTDLPWTSPAYLLLDGVSVPNLLQHLSQWDNPAYSLYANTRWKELLDISPYLVAIKGPNDPLLADFQANAAQEWGYLLFSDAEVHILWSHWRHLLSIKHPSGIEITPRVADPAVMHQLFALAEQVGSARWFGPVSHACLPDGVEGCWLLHKRPDPARAQPDAYQLSDAEDAALGDVHLRNIISGLHDHLRLYFPQFMSTFAAPAGRAFTQKIADEAFQQGFTTEQEIALYANIFGYLAGQSLADHPQIAQTLARATPGASIQHLLIAHDLAEVHAANTQGRLL